jgi:hypothetical protein
LGTVTDQEARLAALEDSISSKEADGVALAPAEAVFRCVWDVEAEVNNGGFFQYFFNSSGAGAPEAVAALRAIGANAAAEIAAKAIGLVDTTGWNDDDRRQEAVESLDDGVRSALDYRDTAFYGYPDDLRGLLLTFAETKAIGG